MADIVIRPDPSKNEAKSPHIFNINFSTANFVMQLSPHIAAVDTNSGLAIQYATHNKHKRLIENIISMERFVDAHIDPESIDEMIKRETYEEKLILLCAICDLPDKTFHNINNNGQLLRSCIKCAKFAYYWQFDAPLYFTNIGDIFHISGRTLYIADDYSIIPYDVLSPVGAFEGMMQWWPHRKTTTLYRSCIFDQMSVSDNCNRNICEYCVKCVSAATRGKNAPIIEYWWLLCGLLHKQWDLVKSIYMMIIARNPRLFTHVRNKK